MARLDLKVHLDPARTVPAPWKQTVHALVLVVDDC